MSKAQQSTRESCENEGAESTRGADDCTEQDVKVMMEKEKWKQTKIIAVVKESCFSPF